MTHSYERWRWVCDVWCAMCVVKAGNIRSSSRVCIRQKTKYICIYSRNNMEKRQLIYFLSQMSDMTWHRHRLDIIQCISPWFTVLFTFACDKSAQNAEEKNAVLVKSKNKNYKRGKMFKVSQQFLWPMQWLFKSFVCSSCVWTHSILIFFFTRLFLFESKRPSYDAHSLKINLQHERNEYHFFFFFIKSFAQSAAQLLWKWGHCSGDK